MSVSMLFDIGRSWASALRGVSGPWRDAIAAAPPGRPEGPAAVARSAPDAQAAGTTIRAAGLVLREAFHTFATRMSPVYATTLYTGASISASIGGVAARLAALPSGPSILRATVAVNTQTSTARASSSPLGLDVVSPEAASTIASTGEMNTGVTTSYGPGSLTFTSGAATSSSTGTLTGTFTGTGAAATATSLNIEITKGDTIGGGLLGLGKGDIDFRVTDQAGAVLFTFSGRLGTNEGVYLGADIGLTISFSSGSLQAGHAASTAITRTPITVDGDAAFNAAPGSRPQFDGGAVVTAGSFSVNGTNITVHANDTINTVIARITASGSGVTASLAGDRIQLTTDAASEDAIAIAGDTSGFVSAAKLAGAVTATGNVRDDQQAFSKTTQFAGVSDGSFTINGVAIAVDGEADSLQTVIARINASAAGVTAVYDEDTDTVIVTPDEPAAALIVGDDTSGFLSAIHMSAGAAGTAANADGAFNATGAGAPLLDPGMSVVAGSFTVNGVSIAVAADDTINTVLARITASDAGVAAAYDEATETVTLTSEGPADPITVGNDTSGFLAAVKLDGTAESVTQPGTSAFETRLDQMAEYGTVGSGAITINGQTVAIDPATATLNGVVSALDALPDVWAEVDEATGAITIRSLPGGALEVTDTSGLLAAVGIAEGTYTGTVGATTALRTQTGTVPSNTSDVVARIQSAVAEVNGALADAAGRAPAGGTGGGLSAALHELVDSLHSLGVNGLSVSTAEAGVALSVDPDALRASLDGMPNPTAGRAAMVAAVDAFTVAASAAAGAALEAAATAAAREPVRIQVPPLPLFEPGVAAAREPSRRAPARVSAYTRETGPVTPLREALVAPAVATPPTGRQPGLFEGLLEEYLR